MTARRGQRDKNGFSLMEVNVAILLVAVGLLSLFALFPLGLKESETAVTDTQESMFADSVLSIIEANAMTITNWSCWAWSSSQDKNDFRSAIKWGFQDVGGGAGVQLDWDAGKTLLQGGGRVAADAMEYPDGSGRYLRYELKLTGSGRKKDVELKVKSGKHVDFEPAQVYYTQIVFMGM